MSGPRRKPIIIEHGGVSFEPPTNHEIEVAASQVTVRRPKGDGGSQFELERTEETDQEVILHVGRKLSDNPDGGYDLPPVRDVRDELNRRWQAAGGRTGALDVWAEGESWHEHLTRARQMVRQAESEGGAT